MPQAAVVSVVDDDESVRNALDSLLRSNGYTVRTYADAETFLASSGPHDTRCLISDIQMPGMSGTQLHDELSARGMNIPVIFITGFQEPLPRQPPLPGTHRLLSEAVLLRRTHCVPRRRVQSPDLICNAGSN